MAQRASAKSKKARTGKIVSRGRVAVLPKKKAAVKAKGKNGSKRRAIGSNGGPGLTDEQVKGELTRLNRLYSDWEKDRDVAKQSIGVYRSALKAAKKIGVDTDAYTAMRDKDRADHGKVIMQSANEGRYLRIIKSPLADLGLFQNLEPPTLDEEPASEKGLRAGRSGFSRTSNPFSPGSEDYATYDESWLKGQTEIANKMGEGAEVTH